MMTLNWLVHYGYVTILGFRDVLMDRHENTEGEQILFEIKNTTISNIIMQASWRLIIN